MRSAHTAVLAAVCSLVLLGGCEDPPPVKLTLDPAGPFKLVKKGQTQQLTATAFDAKGIIYKRKSPVPVTYSSTDTSVATVDGTGLITATGSGAAQVKAQAWDLEATADVTAVIPGSIEVQVPAGTTKDAPFKMRFKTKPVQMVVVVKDDKGVVLPKPKILYRALDYCVEVSEDGLLTPLADGACIVQVSVADVNAKVWVDVRE
jgi:hypothetical protein